MIKLYFTISWGGGGRDSLGLRKHEGDPHRCLLLLRKGRGGVKKISKFFWRNIWTLFNQTKSRILKILNIIKISYHLHPFEIPRPSVDPASKSFRSPRAVSVSCRCRVRTVISWTREKWGSVSVNEQFLIAYWSLETPESLPRRWRAKGRGVALAEQTPEMSTLSMSTPSISLEYWYIDRYLRSTVR